MGSLSNSSLCYASSNKRPLEDGYCTSFGVLVKYKRRKVSAVRNFPHGCGRHILHVEMMSQDTEAVAPLGDKERDCVRTSEVGNDSLCHKLVKSPVKAELPQSLDDSQERKTVLEIGSMVDGKSFLPACVSKAWPPTQWPVSDANILKETALKTKCPRRKVSATRDFPPFCGRNGPWPTEEERLVIVLGKRTLGDPVEASMQGLVVREMVRTKNEGRPLRERERAGAELYWDVPDGNAKKRKLEGSLPEPKTKSQKVIEVDRVIVHGLMVAQNCPWRQGKGGAAVDASLKGMMTGSEVRRHGDRRVKQQKKSKSVGRVNADEAAHLGGQSLKKKLLPKFTIQEQDADPPVGRGPCDVRVILPPFGPNSSSQGNARNKVRETLRLFQAICRKLLQREEAKLRQQGNSRGRIDLQAVEIIRERGKEINTGIQRVGSVPGVEVGDEFQYRVELALVGVHRLYQGGIDYMKHGGTIIATSIVASGGYADDLANPDVLIYSGQGGHFVGSDKQPEDQKLERGNLALKNSISAKNPVRVVHGSKETKTSTSDARAKIVLTHTYDGLYTVDRYWRDVGPHGKLVFMFELKRIPGQPDVVWKEVIKSNKFKTREGLCIGDISGGKELFPICAVNTKDKGKPPKFNYITKMKYPDCYCPTPARGCDCIGGCSVTKKCSCLVKNGGEFPYNFNGAIVEAKTLVYECGPACKCPPSCYNRVSQHGIKIQLEIFKTQSRGWGVRSLTSIPSATFICEYVGVLLEDKEAEQRQNDEYLFDIGQNYSDCSQVSALNPEAQRNSSGVVEDSYFTIDAAQCANVGRFINHSCSPNLYAQNVLYDHEDKRMPHIMLFAAENIPPLQELTYHYNYSVDQIRDSNGQIKVKNCYCGSAQCTGRMY